MAKTTANDRFARSVIPTEDMHRIVKSIRREPTILQRLLGWLQTATVDDKWNEMEHRQLMLDFPPGMFRISSRGTTAIRSK